MPNNSPMPTDSTTDKNSDNSTPAQKPYTVYGWAEIGPSTTIQLPQTQDVEEIPHEQLIEALKKELRDQGFSTEQIKKIHIDVDCVEETIHS